MGTDTLHTLIQSATVPWELIGLEYVKCWDSEKYNIYTFEELDSEQKPYTYKKCFSFLIFPCYFSEKYDILYHICKEWRLKDVKTNCSNYREAQCREIHLF